MSGSHIELQSGPSERSLVFRARDLRVTDRPPSLSTIDQSKAVVVGGIGKRPPPRRRSKNTQLEMPRSESCSPPEACFSHSLDNPGLGTPPMDAMSPHCQHTLGGELLSLETNFLSKHTGSNMGGLRENIINNYNRTKLCKIERIPTNMTSCLLEFVLFSTA